SGPMCSTANLCLPDVPSSPTRRSSDLASSIIQIDNTHTVTLSAVTIHGGTINDGTLAGDGSVAGLDETQPHGTIHVTGNTAIDNNTTAHNCTPDTLATRMLTLDDKNVT